MRKSLAKQLAFGTILLTCTVSAVVGIFIPEAAFSILIGTILVAVISFALAIAETAASAGAAAVTFAFGAAGLFAGAGVFSVVGIFAVFGAFAIFCTIAGTVSAAVAIWLTNETIDDRYTLKGA